MSTALGTPAPAGSIPWTPTPVATRTMRTFVSPTVGIVRRVFERMRDTDDLQAFSTGSEACDSRVLLGSACNKINGGGGLALEGSRLAAIGEAVERYSAAWVPFQELEYGAYRDLTARGLDCLPPGQYTPFADWQYDQPDAPAVRFTDQTAVPWVESRRLADGALVWIPAQAVYLRGDLGAKNPITYGTSNGLAYGNTTDEALVSGILELVERDAVMLTWYRSLSMPLLDISSDPRLAAYMARHVAPTGLAVSLVDLSAFTGIAVVLAVIRNDHPETASLGLGAAASGSPVRAATKAVTEATSTRSWAVSTRRAGIVVDPESDFNETVRSFDDHIALYARPSLIRATRFLDGSTQRSTVDQLPAHPSETPGELRDALVATLARGGIDLYAVDATSPDVREAGGHVVKVFSPQLQPLDAGFRRRSLGGARLRTRPAELGLVAPGNEDSINPMPHPFP
jgi:ribosomal protein S12 methylthiotransferase accessory factor